jgi:hypothetical protein
MIRNKSAVKLTSLQEQGTAGSIAWTQITSFIPPDVRTTYHSRVILIYHVWLVHLLQTESPAFWSSSFVEFCNFIYNFHWSFRSMFVLKSKFGLPTKHLLPDCWLWCLSSLSLQTRYNFWKFPPFSLNRIIHILKKLENWSIILLLTLYFIQSSFDASQWKHFHCLFTLTRVQIGVNWCKYARACTHLHTRTNHAYHGEVILISTVL